MHGACGWLSEGVQGQTGRAASFQKALRLGSCQFSLAPCTAPFLLGAVRDPAQRQLVPCLGSLREITRTL